tara:strand:+ start:12241 stop:13008 length:768 start_codon:yes stop_codon:yes gene_type:complete
VEVNEHTGEVMMHMMRTSKELNEIGVALATAQAEFPVLPKTKKVMVKTHDGKGYSYSYADLALIIETILPITSKHGLSIIQMPSVANDRNTLVTRLLHSSGQWIECELPLKQQRDGAQALGSSLTYMRRYGISSILCLATDEDDDGQIADTDHVNAKPQVKRGVTTKANNIFPKEEDAKKFIEKMIFDAKKISEYEEVGLAVEVIKNVEEMWLNKAEKISEIQKLYPKSYENLRQEFGFIRDRLEQDSKGEEKDV